MAKRNGFGWCEEALRACRTVPPILPAVVFRCRRLDTEIGETPNPSSQPYGLLPERGKGVNLMLTEQA
jgi:hypothetical protein